MRDFYRTYENHPTLLSRAMKLGWIQNVVIMEADMTTELREWYMKAAKQFGWSKSDLVIQMANNAHTEIMLVSETGIRNADRANSVTSTRKNSGVVRAEKRYPDHRIHSRAYRKINRKSLRIWNTLVWSMQQEQQIVYMRC